MCGSKGVYWGGCGIGGVIGGVWVKGGDGVMKSNGEVVVVVETGDLYSYFITGLYGGLIWESWDGDRVC